jgi:hypothetical protein
MKQTAVEWLVDYIENQNKYGYEFHPKYAEHIVQQAKEMEKEQIINAIIISEKEHIIQGNVYPPKFVVDKAKKYYNETFTN